MSACEGSHSDPTCGLTVRDGFQLTKDMTTPTIAWPLTLMSPGRSHGMNGNVMPTKEVARVVTHLSLFSGCVVSALP